MKNDIISGVYQIKNKINNKLYIGSSHNLEKRKYEHFKMLKENKHHSPKLQNAFNKYGEENFVFEIIKLINIKNLKSIEKRNILLNEEQFWIDKLQTVKYGYNTCPIAGSRLGTRLTEEQRKNLSEKQKGVKRKPFTKTHIENMKKGQTGKKLSEKTKNKIRQAFSKKVLRIEDNKIFPSATEASLYVNCHRTNISKCCNGERKTAGGYHWKFID